MLSVFFAFLGAASNATGTVLQRKAALSVPSEDALKPRILADLVHQPIFLLGICGVAGAALFQALALVTGPLALVQPVFILELPLALLISLPVLHRALPRSGWIAVGFMVVGLVFGLACAAPSGGHPQAPLAKLLPAVAVCVGVILFTVTAARHRRAGPARAALLATGSAVGNALTAALLKSSADTFSSDGLDAFLTTWQTYAFAVTGIVAVFLLENALQAGPIAASQPALTLGDAVVSLILGITVYGEQVRTGWWLLPELAAIALIVTGTIHLSRAVPLTRELAN